ncbi:circadian clock KaiB family protein, partial [Thermodesulfobacteriota bacterium]
FQDEWSKEYSLEVIDVLDRPDLAGQDRIIATPTLVKVSPDPVRKIIGDLSMKGRILQALGLVNN